MEPIVEDEFGDNTHWMDIDLPDDSAVSTREKTLLLNMRQNVAAIKIHGLTFVAISHVTSPDGLLFIEKLDWEQVRKLGGKNLQL